MHTLPVSILKKRVGKLKERKKEMVREHFSFFLSMNG